MNVGIDTLKLSFTDYEITKDSKLIVQPASFELGTGTIKNEFYLFDLDGKEISGKNAYYNDPEGMFNLTLSPKHGRTIPFVQLSIPKNYYGDNYKSVGKEETKQVLNKLGRRLKDVGFKANIADAKLSRVDTFKTIQTEETFLTYSPLFDAIEGKRKYKRDYGTTYLWANSMEEVSAYDKIAEMLLRKKDVSNLNPNSIRFEDRLMQAKKIVPALGVSTVKELIKDYGILQAYYNKTMSENLFKYKGNDLPLTTTEQLEYQVEYFMDRYKRDWLSRFLITLSASDRIKQDRYLSAIKNVLKRRGESSNTIKVKVHRTKKKLQQFRLDTVLSKRSGAKDKTVMVLYKELKEKVLKVA